MTGSTAFAEMMTRMPRASFLLSSLVLLLVSSSSDAHRRHERHESIPGKFDYYVLSLSWSPQYCAVTGKEGRQCEGERHYGFIVHGLWPQNDHGYPSFCHTGQRLDHQVIESMLDILPSEELITHEWVRHGTCSGLDPNSYFHRVRAAFSSVKIPSPYQQPAKPFRVSAEEITNQFSQVNPGFDKDTLAVSCRTRFLTEIRICLTKDLAPRHCGPDIETNCQARELTVRPVRS